MKIHVLQCGVSIMQDIYKQKLSVSVMDTESLFSKINDIGCEGAECSAHRSEQESY